MNDDSDSHPGEARLLAYLDGELPPDERAGISRHLVECRACAGTLDELRGASDGLSAALSRLEPPESQLTAGDVRRADGRAVGAGTEETVVGEGEDRRERTSGRTTALRIAASVAVLLGAAAALPGSPLRSWIGRSVQEVQALLGGGAVQESAERPEPPRHDVADRSGVTDRSGVAVGPAEGSVRIRLVRVPASAAVRVRLVDGSKAGVWNAGGEFRTASGLIEVVAPTSGEILVEIPRSVYSVRLEVNGETAAVKRGGRLDVRVPGAVLRDGEFEFTPGPAGTR